MIAQRKGAKAIIATLWPVADDSTTLLMQQFYRVHEMERGISKAEALRRAQLALLEGDRRSESSPLRAPLFLGTFRPHRKLEMRGSRVAGVGSRENDSFHRTSGHLTPLFFSGRPNRASCG